MNNKIDLSRFIVTKDDYKRMMDESVDIRQKIMDNATQQIAKINEKNAEQAIIASILEENKQLMNEIIKLRGLLEQSRKLTVDYIHDIVIDHCETAEECRQEIVSYSMTLCDNKSTIDIEDKED